MIERTAPIDPVTISERPNGAEIKAYREAAGVSRDALSANESLRAVARGRLLAECDPVWFIDTVEEWYADHRLDRGMVRRYIAAIDAIAGASPAA